MLNPFLFSRADESLDSSEEGHIWAKEKNNMRFKKTNKRNYTSTNHRKQHI